MTVTVTRVPSPALSILVFSSENVFDFFAVVAGSMNCFRCLLDSLSAMLCEVDKVMNGHNFGSLVSES